MWAAVAKNANGNESILEKRRARLKGENLRLRRGA
jgi:hypothetical protein